MTLSEQIVSSIVDGPVSLGRHATIRESTGGRYVGLNDYSSVLRCDMGSYIAIGVRVSVNPFSHPTDWLSTHEFQYHASAYASAEYRNFIRLPRSIARAHRLSMGSDIWIGDNAIVLANLGDGSVVGAGSVVTKPVEPYVVVAGNPARIIRKRFDDRIIERLLALRWWDMPLASLSGLPFNDVGRCLDMLEERRGAACA